MRLALLIRSLFVAGSWNYRDLLTVGLSWVLMPVAKDEAVLAVTTDESAVGGHFNAHPYLVPLAVGVLARASRDGGDAALIQRLKDALRGPLGSLGDQLVWGAWRPMCLGLAGAAMVLGAPPLITVLGLLVVYNALNLALRWWGLTAGLASGTNIARELRRIDFPTRTERVKVLGVLVFGAFVGLLAGVGLEVGPWANAAGLGLLVVGVVYGSFVRRWAPLLLILLVVAGFLVPGLPGEGA